MKNYHIYKFINRENEVIYIGQTTLPIIRFQEHKYNREYWDEVCKILIAPCNTEIDMIIYEIYYINKFKPKYNIEYLKEEYPTIKMRDLVFEELLVKKNNEKIIGFDTRKIKRPNNLKIITKQKIYNNNRYENRQAKNFIKLCEEIINNKHLDLQSTCKNRKGVSIIKNNIYNKQTLRNFIGIKDKSNFSKIILKDNEVIKFFKINNIINIGQSLDFNNCY